MNKTIKSDKTALVPRLRFPEFRNAGDWKEEPLGNIAEIIKEKAGQQKCTLLSITSGIGLVSQMEKFGREIAGSQYKNYVVIRNNDFAYNKSATKEYPEGFIAMYCGRDIAAVPNSIFTCFRIQDSTIYPKYLNYLFSMNLHGKWLRRFIAVGARAHGALSVDDKDLLTLPVLLPDGVESLPEQQKIADCLSSIDDLITAQTKKVETLKAHKKGLMQQLFPGEGEALPRLRFTEFQDAGEWKDTPLGQLSSYDNGKAYEKDIKDNGKYIVVNSRFISTDGAVRKYTNAKYLIADAGDVLMVLSDLPKGKALAKCFFVESNDRYAVNQRVCRIKAGKVDAKFLFYILNRNSHLLAFDDGLNQTHLSKGSVLECPLCVPPQIVEQQKIADVLSCIDGLIASQADKLDALKTHKKGLMQQLFPTQEAFV